MDLSKMSSAGFKNKKVQAGSDPGLLTLLGIHFSGIAARRSQPTCKITTTIAIMTRKRYPFRLRYRNLNNMMSPFPYPERYVTISLSIAESSLGRGLLRRLTLRVAILNKSAASYGIASVLQIVVVSNC